MNVCALTTVDNPFNPFDDFVSWFLYDVEKNYNSCGYLARIANVTDDLSEEEEAKEIERAIDEIISYDFMNIYKKVTKDINIYEDMKDLDGVNE